MRVWVQDSRDIGTGIRDEIKENHEHVCCHAPTYLDTSPSATSGVERWCFGGMFQTMLRLYTQCIVSSRSLEPSKLLMLFQAELECYIQYHPHLSHPKSYTPLVFSSLPFIHSRNFRPSRARNPTLNGFGSVVKLVGSALHSSASRIGSSAGDFGESMWKATMRRTKAV